MNKNILIGMLTTSLVLGGALSVGAVGNGNTHVSQITATGEIISSKNAEEIALQKVHGKVDSVELKKKANQSYYEVEIEKKHIDYDVLIDAITGKVQSVHKDENDREDNDSKDKRYLNTTENLSTISPIEAISIARKPVNGVVTKVEKNTVEGIQKYKIVMNTSKNQAAIEINAMTGEILKVDYNNDFEV
ncbi:PepSY domain-containing protein [Bacillus sp. FJAT-49732]|uniref:PepSY domain-containing protein n=1 Tax=Lederbergia citrisecunda TaxID=2833583 RepID=A0A942TS14_9BACI|nr:PepSY domain-containing protein [Lederbergia citrisecunda]MBS4201097.1 PepSY domain-containing protein [Lederbergia citrisecunda]